MTLPLVGAGTANASATDCPYAYFDSNGLWQGNISIWQSSGETGAFVCLNSRGNWTDLTQVHYSNGLDVAHHIASIANNGGPGIVWVCTGKNFTGSCATITPGYVAPYQNLSAPYLNNVLSVEWMYYPY